MFLFQNSGATELIAWGNTDAADYKTYWPINMLPGQTARQRLEEWAAFRWKAVSRPGNIFNTAWRDSQITVTPIPRTENLFAVQRIYRPSSDHVATFFVSFQALNAYTNLADVVASPQGEGEVELVYEGRGIFSGGRLKLSWIYLINNDVFITLS